jgi:cobyric acid synthase CobQ
VKLNQHGGNCGAIAEGLGLRDCPEVKLDFSVNLNPLGPPPALIAALGVEGRELAAGYPQEYAEDACAALADAHGLPSEQVIAGSGATEIFGWIVQAFRPKAAAEIAPCYAGYGEVCRAYGVECTSLVSVFPDSDFCLEDVPVLPHGCELVFIGSPNNPTGRAVSCKVLMKLAELNPGCIVVVDASFSDFMVDDVVPSLSEMAANMVVVKSLTKFFCIPGVRLGMAWGGADIMDAIKKSRLPWSVNGIAQNLACRLYSDKKYLKDSREKTAELRLVFMAALRRLPGFKVYPCDADFVLVRLPQELSVSLLQGELLKRGILIRSCAGFAGLGSRYCRLAVRPLSEQEQLLDALADCIAGGRVVDCGAVTPAVMVVGTTSDAGKSVVAAGLCRLLARRGVRTAPFKAQNMALNSYVTVEGGEMGRAQVVQAEAAGVVPHTDMNPVLLKPICDNGSQVIVNGKAVGVFKAQEYYTEKAVMRQAAHDAYDRLAAQYDFVVLEGAGSPAEINLLEEDFVNMDMAAYAAAKTVLVADIDRGGVFASILGTIQLVPQKYRHLIAGVIINKFRGDASLLDSGLRDIEAMTGVPVLGVLNYLKDLRIEEEDSLGLERSALRGNAVLNVVVIRLPHISNFTDFMAMEGDGGVSVRYVRDAVDVGDADLVIIPGSKSTRSDLQWLHESGFGDVLRELRGRGVPLIGICGGYQMLGMVVVDSAGTEGAAGSTEGLGFLPVETELCDGKELAQVEGVTAGEFPFGGGGLRFRGYEIHAGRSLVGEGCGVPLEVVRRGGKVVSEPSGAVADLVFGCYVHGFFDSEDVRRELWRWLCLRKGVAADCVAVAERASEREFDRLADHLEHRLDLGVLGL